MQSDSTDVVGSNNEIRRLGRSLLVIAVLVAEIATLWITTGINRSFIFPTVFVVLIGLGGLIAMALMRLVPLITHRHARASFGLLLPSLIAVATVAIVLAGLLWALPLKMKVAESRATKVAESLVPAHDGSTVCTRSPSDRSAVSSLMSAKQVCILGTLPNDVVQFESSGTSGKTGVNGLLFAPNGFNLGIFALGQPYVTVTACTRHLLGQWWVYQQDGSGCASGFEINEIPT